MASMLPNEIDIIKMNASDDAVVPATGTENDCHIKIGNDIFLMRTLVGLTQSELAKSCGISKETIRNIERLNKPVPLRTSKVLEEFITAQPNGTKLCETIAATNSTSWVDWLISILGKRPKVTSISCTKCKSQDVNFTTARGTCKLVKTKCCKCGFVRYTANPQFLRIQEWRTAERIDPFRNDLFIERTQSETKLAIPYINGVPIIIHKETLIAIRIKSGLSIRQMTDKTGLSADIIKRCENGSRPIDSMITDNFVKTFRSHAKLFDAYQQISELDNRRVKSAILTERTKNTANKRIIKQSINKLLGELND
ncbi:helix-turn-helix domain-containing protein [Vibrio owensii]|uniref:helix-turn-helix domain-containing protein n=1 Tax=Vibrio owensii TaxID=696485 RepID=UPI0018F1B56C|nr:helix-turn-helix transcriptional regulator [Vibrio owensii]